MPTKPTANVLKMWILAISEMHLEQVRSIEMAILNRANLLHSLCFITQKRANESEWDVDCCEESQVETDQFDLKFRVFLF